MKRWTGIVSVAALSLVFAGAAAGDTLEFKDGRVLHGRFLGGTAATLRFEQRGNVETYNVSDIVALTFTGDYGNGAAERPGGAPLRESAPPPPQNFASNGMITIPAGQSILVRMIDGVDSSKNHVGDIFHASLETDLTVNDMLVAKKGTDVYGRLAESKEAGHLSGSAELQLELTRMVIDGRDYPVVSSDYTLQGKGRGKNTAEKVGGGAALGAIIGAIAGGGKGAAIGAGVGAGAGGAVQVLTRGQQVRVPSETLLEFRLQQPATVSPVQS
jgi:hypothetical protein